MDWPTILEFALVALRGAVMGAGIAARVDYMAFMSWKSDDELRNFNWRLARFRWVQGAVIGAVTALGIF